MRKWKIVGVALAGAIFCSMFTGCYDRREVDDLCYAIAVGLDEGKVNPLKMTIQYAIPLAIGGSGGGGGGGGGGGESTGTVTIEAPSIYSGINMANNFIGKQINMSHAKVAVFSEALAKNGKMHDYIHAMVRGREFRPNMSIAVARDSAEEYIKSVKPVQEADPAKYYELKFATYTYTGFTANTQLSVFYNKQESYSIQAVATLVGVGKYEQSKGFDPTKSTYKEKGRDKPLMGDYLAGDIPRSGDVKGETLGLAVFDGAKMVGEMDGQEATMHLISSGQFHNAFLTFPDPEVPESSVVLNLKQSRSPKQSVKIQNGKPQINIDVKLEGDFLSIQSGINYEQGQKLEDFERAGEEFLRKELLQFLNRTTKVFHSDICGFGNKVKGKFLTWKEWTGFNWLGKYTASTFQVQVDLKVRRTGLMIRSLPSVSSHGEEE